MFARLGKFLVILALVLTTGLHWAALQTVAWTTMLADNLRTHSVAEAMTKTFDGKHPCCLCKAIAAGKKSEQKSEAVTPSLKMEFPPTTERFTLFAPAQFQLLPQVNTFAESVTRPPLTPPPRSAIV